MIKALKKSENPKAKEYLKRFFGIKCPECSSKDTLMWVDENRQEMDAKHLDCLVPIRKLELQEYLSPEILKMEHI